MILWLHSEYGALRWPFLRPLQLGAGWVTGLAPGLWVFRPEQSLVWREVMPLHLYRPRYNPRALYMDPFLLH